MDIITWRIMLMRKWLLAAAAAAIIAAPSAVVAQAPIVIKFSHVVAPNTPKGKGAERFKELAEKYTNGKVKVEVYPNSSLYKDKEELEALQTGVVDGQENTPSNMYTMKFDQVQKYTTLTQHGYIGYVVVANKKFWDGLPADIRTQLTKAMKEATAYSNSISQTENDEALDEMKKAGKTQIIIPTAAQTAAMRKAMDPVYADVTARVGKKLLDEVLKETQGVTH